MVHLMSAGRIRYLAPGREEPEDAGVPAALRRRRRARPHRGRAQEARGRLADAARRGRGGARLPRPRGRHADAPRRWRRSSRPTRGGSTRCCATSARSPASAAPGRTRSSTSARLSPYALSTQLDAEETAAPRGRDPQRARARARAAARGRGEPGRLPRPRPARRAVPELPARRSRWSTSRSTRSTTARTARPTAACSKDRRMSRLLR